MGAHAAATPEQGGSAGPGRGVRVTVAVLGPTTVDGTSVTDRQRALLAALVLHRGGIDTSTLVDAIWGGRPPRSARQSLQNQVSRLRAAWGADLLVTEGTTYRLRAATDVEQVGAAADRWLGRPADARAVPVLQSAVARFRGTPYADLPEHGPAEPERARLAELRLQLAEHLAVSRLVAGDPGPAARELAVLTELDPFREHGWALLMVALQRSGRRTDALAAYERAATTLRRELGAEPSAGLRRLRDDVEAGRDDVGDLLVPPTAVPPSRRAACGPPLRARYRPVVCGHRP